MLTSEHAIVSYNRNRAVPDRLLQSDHGHYVAFARRMLNVYRQGRGLDRRELHRRVERIFYKEPDCPPRRIAAFCKLLDDASVYRTAPDAWRLRMEVFRQAAEHHPLVTTADRLFENEEQAVKQVIAKTIGREWERIETELYADVMECQRLDTFEGYGRPVDLLRRYNVAQLQACLYKAKRMIVRATTDFKTVLRYVKLSKLLHEIRRMRGGAYEITLTGPASELLPTRRYGVNFARFLPALLACRGWWMQAEVDTPWGRPARLELSDRDGFTSHLPAPDEFDSSVEEKFVERFGPERDGWTLVREGAILHHRQKTFVPDFLFRHEDGTEVLMEIVGFWTPEYLQRKRETLRAFSGQAILLAVQAGILRSDPTGENTIPYKTVIKVKPVLEALDRFRPTDDSGPLPAAT